MSVIGVCILYFKWIMLVSGLLNCTMFQAFVSPKSFLLATFGQTFDNHLSEMIVRNWGALIGLMGIMLIYGAFVESVMKFVIVIAGTSKAIFIILILLSNVYYMKFGARTALIADSIMIIVYMTYLLLSKKNTSRV